MGKRVPHIADGQKYPVTLLCNLMGVNRSGYHKWRSRQGKKNRYEMDRKILTKLLQEQHQLHPSHGYHRLDGDVFDNTGWVFSDNLAHKCCKEAGIWSKTRKLKYVKPGKESVKFPNLVAGHWNAQEPLQILVGYDFKNKGVSWEWTILLDTFNNEIIAHQATTVTGSNKPYYFGLDKLKGLAGKKNEEQTPR